MPLTEVVYSVGCGSYPLGRLSVDHPGLVLTFDHVTFDGKANDSKSLVVARGGVDAVHGVSAQLSRVYDDHRVLIRRPDELVAKGVASRDRMQECNDPALLAWDGFGEDAVCGPSLIRGGVYTTAVVVPQERHDEILGRLLEVGAHNGHRDFMLKHVKDYDPTQHTTRLTDSDLTAKQTEALKTALVLGFYNTPKNANLEDLAHVFGISKAAVHNRLQAAERKVVTKHFG